MARSEQENPPLPEIRVIPNPRDGTVKVPWDFIVVRDQPEGGREAWIRKRQGIVESRIKGREAAQQAAQAKDSPTTPPQAGAVNSPRPRPPARRKS